ncbi:TPA: hypothetical protein ACPJ2O_004464 [Vibrio diabolicus]
MRQLLYCVAHPLTGRYVLYLDLRYQLKITGTGVVAIFTIAVFCFGMLIGFTSFGEIYVGIRWTDIMSAIGSMLAGFGTVVGVFVAFYVGGQWRKQNKVNSYLAYYETLIKLFDCAIERGLLFTNRVKNDYPNDPELTEYERNRLGELREQFDYLVSALINEYAKLELLYLEEEVKPLNPLQLRLALNKYQNVQYVYRPHEVDYDEYEGNVQREFKNIKELFDAYKNHVKSVINKT